MGILAALSGWKKVLNYRVVSGTGSQVGVQVESCVPEVMRPDYIRLWAMYFAKIMFNPRFPQHTSSVALLGFVDNVVGNGIEPHSDLFRLADIDDVISYADTVTFSGITATGEFYARGSVERTIQTHFPSQITEQQIVYGSFALMQYAADTNSADPYFVAVLDRTAAGMVRAYRAGAGGSISDIVRVSTTAYLEALSGR